MYNKQPDEKIKKLFIIRDFPYPEENVPKLSSHNKEAFSCCQLGDY